MLSTWPPLCCCSRGRRLNARSSVASTLDIAASTSSLAGMAVGPWEKTSLNRWEARLFRAQETKSGGKKQKNYHLGGTEIKKRVAKTTLGCVDCLTRAVTPAITSCCCGFLETKRETGVRETHNI